MYLCDLHLNDFVKMRFTKRTKKKDNLVPYIFKFKTLVYFYVL